MTSLKIAFEGHSEYTDASIIRGVWLVSEAGEETPVNMVPADVLLVLAGAAAIFFTEAIPDVQALPEVQAALEWIRNSGLVPLEQQEVGDGIPGWDGVPPPEDS